MNETAWKAILRGIPVDRACCELQDEASASCCFAFALVTEGPC